MKSPDIQVVRDLVQCLSFIDDVDYSDDRESSSLVKAADFIARFYCDTSGMTEFHPLIPVSELLVTYMEKHPEDVTSFICCIRAARDNSKPSTQISKGSKCEFWLLMDKLKKNRTDEETVRLIADAFCYHENNPTKRLLSKSNWLEIAKNPNCKDVPYEWLHSMFS